MDAVRRAIHICSGRTAAGKNVDDWLARHAVAVVRCADAFEACTHIVSSDAPEPELAFVGADWLAPQELVILDYLRQAWPGIRIVVYARRLPAALREAPPGTLVCQSQTALPELLATGPDGLLSRFHPARRSPASCRRLDQGAAAHAGADEGGRGRPGPQARGAVGGQQPAACGDSPASTVPRDMLTPDEWRALLQDAHG